MPGSDQETTLARQWELLKNHLPPRPPGRTSRELRDLLEAAGHNVSKHNRIVLGSGRGHAAGGAA